MLRASGHPPDVRAGDDLWNDQVVVFARVLDVVACVEISRPGGVPYNLFTPVVAIDHQRRVFVQRPQGQVEGRHAENIQSSSVDGRQDGSISISVADRRRRFRARLDDAGGGSPLQKVPRVLRSY